DLVLAAFVLRRLPPEQRVVERHALLVVRYFERNVIEPDRLPVRRRERRRRRRLHAAREVPLLRRRVADLQIEAAGILDVETLEVAAVVRDRIQAARLQCRFHLLGIPLIADAPAEAVDGAVARRTRTAAAAGGGCGRRRRGRGRRLEPAADHERAPSVDVERRLLAVVGDDLPVHQRLVERRFLLVVDGLAGEVIEHDRLPSGALERQLGGRRIALGQVRARAAALALREAGGRTQRRRARGREAQGLQQPTPGQTAAVVFLEQSGQVITHRTLPPERRVCAGRRRRVESVTTCHEAGARRANASSAACSAASALPRATLVARWRACA